MKYKILCNVRHNGKKYNQGDEVDLDADTAQKLLKAKVVEALLMVAPANEMNGMTKAELVAMAKEKFGVELNKDDNKETLLAKIAELEKAQAESKP
jgi:ribosomal protein L21E